MFQMRSQAEAVSDDAPQPVIPELAMIVPCHNEQESIAPLIAEIVASLDTQCDYELIVVDDGSSDATSTVLRDLAHPNLRVLSLPTRRGQSTALTAGVRAARAPLIATLDGDGQNPPAELPKLIDRYRQFQAPVVIVGWRRGRRDGWLRRLSSRLANGLRSRLLDDHCPDTGCGLKVFNRHGFLALPAFDHMHRFLPALFRHSGTEVINVPVNHRARTAGRSKYGVGNRLWVGLVDLVGVLWLARRSVQPKDAEEWNG